jgi:hypothetical protein
MADEKFIKNGGHMIRFLFYISSILFASSMSVAAGSKSFNLRYAGGPMIEFGLGRFGFGVGANSISSTSYDSSGFYTISGSTTTGKLSIYSSGMGTDSWYAAGTVGILNLKADRTLSGTDYSATAGGSYSGFTVGYHWFWNVFNLNLGMGSTSVNLNKIEIKDSSNSTINTIEGAQIKLPAIDLGFGLAF